MGKTIDGQARTIILQVLNFFEHEKANKQFVIPVDQAIKRACAATGVSKGTLIKIKNESKKLAQSISPAPSTSASRPGARPILQLPTPGKKRKPSSQKIELDHFDLCALRDMVNNFYTVRKEAPTLKKILAAAKSELNFPGGITTLRLILINRLGYKFKKCKNERPVLIINNAKKFEKEYWEKDRLQEIEQRNRIISLGAKEIKSEIESRDDDNSDTMSRVIKKEINYNSDDD